MTKKYPELLEEYPMSLRIFIKRISNRIDSGKNALIGIFGQTGGGKSLAGIQIIRGLYLYRMGEEPTNEYLLEHLYFKSKTFMEAMQKVSNVLDEDKKNLVKGKAHLWDETGVDASSKDALTMKNKILGWLVQTFRNQQQVVLFTTPSFFMIDKTIRNLLHYYLEVVSIDKKNKITICKPLELQYNVRIDKMYYHNIIYPTREEEIEIEFMGVPKISDELEYLYELKKNKFTKDLNDHIVFMLNKIELKDSGEGRLTERQKGIFGLLKNGVYSTNEIAKELGIDASSVSENFNFMRNKGVDIDSLKKKAKLGEFGGKTDTST